MNSLGQCDDESNRCGERTLHALGGSSPPVLYPLYSFPLSFLLPSFPPLSSHSRFPAPSPLLSTTIFHPVIASLSLISFLSLSVYSFLSVFLLYPEEREKILSLSWFSSIFPLPLSPPPFLPKSAPLSSILSPSFSFGLLNFHSTQAEGIQEERKSTSFRSISCMLINLGFFSHQTVIIIVSRVSRTSLFVYYC